MSFITEIKALTRQLYPTGRAFKMPYNGDLQKLHNGLAISENQALLDARAILNSILPDNSSFTADDATDWERRLGLVSNSAVSLADRKLAIQRKINHPGNIPARQHYLYLEGQLQAAGFDLYVHENRFDLYPDTYETRTALFVSSGLGLYPIQMGDWQHGDRQHGDNFDPTKLVINSIDEDIDALFDIGDNLRSTFFIGGATVGDFANVDEERKTELRQLILKIKPVQTVAYLFINYV